MPANGQVIGLVQTPQITGAVNQSTIAKSAAQVPVVLAAAVTNFGSLQPTTFVIPYSGTKFYVLAASSPIYIKPVRAGASGVSNKFGIGQGQPVPDGFDVLEVSNPNPFPVVALIWVGFQEFINDQLILVNNSYQQIANPTQSNTSYANPVINIPDLSGQTFNDLSGNNWGAVQRVAILVFNQSSGTTLTLQGGLQTGSGSATAPAVGVIQPLQPIRFDFGGNYSISLGGAAVPAIVSEIYNAFLIT